MFPSFRALNFCKFGGIYLAYSCKKKNPSRSILTGESMSVQILKLLLGYVNDMWLAGNGMKKLKWGEKNIEEKHGKVVMLY